jgi:hypothetical protein
VAEDLEDVILPGNGPEKARRRLEHRLENRVVTMRVLVGVGGCWHSVG